MNFSIAIKAFAIKQKRYFQLLFCFIWQFISLQSSWAQAQATPSAFSFSGHVQSDLRFRPVKLSAGDAWYNRANAPLGISRNQNLFNLHLNCDLQSVAFTVDTDFLWLGFTKDVALLEDLYERNRIDPFRLKLHAAYVEMRDFLLPGLDVRLGQQVINWGKGDQFNPTNTINANDFEDPLLFGHQLANNIIRLDYTTESFSWALVLVPVFKPTLLPPSAFMALANLQRVLITEASVRLALLGEQLLSRDMGYPAVIGKIWPDLPAPTFANIQGAAHVSATFLNHDVSLSYYIGRSDIPQPTVISTQLQPGGCSPLDANACVEGLLRADVRLHYPRMQVIGLNLAGEVPLLKFWAEHLASFGYHLELGLFLPETVDVHIFKGAILGQPAGEYDYGLANGAPPHVVLAKPFAKWNLGLDYTLFQRVYVNAQWVHGFVDEFGAGDYFYASDLAVFASKKDIDCDDPSRCVTTLSRSRLGDYLVVGADARFLNDKLLTRLFVVYDVTGLHQEAYDFSRKARITHKISAFSQQGATAVLFPELTYNAGGGLELSVGAIAKLGHSYTKFGDPAAGGTDIWTRARYSY